MNTLASFVLAAAVIGATTAASPPPRKLTTESFRVDGGDPGIQLYLRNKHPADTNAFAPDRIVLFVHGATYPSETVFDVDLPGGSWMERAAGRGYDAWLVDVRGYGGSTRPAAMAGPPGDNPTFARTDEAERDVAAAVRFILRHRHAEKLNLVAWSWGTALVAGFAAEHGEQVHKLVLYAPIWIFKAPPPLSGEGAYRSVRKEEARQRSIRGIPEDRVADVAPASWFETWWSAVLASDPEGARRDPPVVRAPNGVIRDLAERWAAGKPTYDPARIRVPTLIIGAEWDHDAPPYMAQELFARIVNAPLKRHVSLGEGTHAVFMEKGREELITQVQSFLEQPLPAPTAVGAR